MQLTIKGSNTIAELQKVFNDEFAFLKIVFFSRPHKEHDGSKANYLLNDRDCPLSQLTSLKREGALDIDAKMTVWQLENQLEEDFGLHVQVFRKSGHAWLETSRTDDQTLEVQNERGRMAETPVVPIEDPIDYRDQD